MKKWIFLLVIISVVSYALYYTFSDVSYDYYRDAEKLYQEGKYKEAYDLLDIGQRENQLNRKIIALKGKLYPIVQGQENLKEAKALYEESVNLALEGKIDAAKLAMSKAYELAGKISPSSLVKADADELIRKIERDSTLVLENAPEVEYKNAVKLENQGELLRAYEALKNIDVQNEKVRRKKSELAYRIGNQRYSEIKNANEPNEHLILDAVFWYSQVQAFDDNYSAAGQRINELKLMKTK